jgi:outer membrane lipopolysaccharide assembly protein LptE/RlpB
MPNHRSIPALLAVLFALPLAGCGYHMSGNTDNEPNYRWHTLYRGDVSTVAVPIFGNRTYYQGMEFRLTKSIISQLEGQSPYKVVPKERADTLLEGEIIAARLQTLSNNRISSVPQEQLLLFIVRFTWRDLRSGKILVQRQSFEQTAPYYPTLGEDQFVGQEQNLEKLALAIVQELQADWGIAPPLDEESNGSGEPSRTTYHRFPK